MTRLETITEPVNKINLVTRIELKVVCVKHDLESYVNVVQVENLLQASRFINTFKPKRGYVVLSWNIQEVEVFA